MTRLITAARALIEAGGAEDPRVGNDAMRAFVERVTFATADDIRAMPADVLADDWTALPWARNLSYRLACLQQPGDRELLREAAADLYSFGPDWDGHARRLRDAADGIGEIVPRRSSEPDQGDDDRQDTA
ncbi:hypothetical protein [Actinoplanes xinjiangensis]|uniref:hypothetical protein n=1 Tax=Actinoplanes xinjiangensis TaxID=512350 RepID=UPI003443304D